MISNLHAALEKYLAMPKVAWSLGAFGAIAEFMWHADEPQRREGLSLTTPRGGLRAAPAPDATLRLYTTPSRYPARRRHELALCLPRDACAMGAARVGDRTRAGQRRAA